MLLSQVQNSLGKVVWMPVGFTAYRYRAVSWEDLATSQLTLMEPALILQSLEDWVEVSVIPESCLSEVYLTKEAALESITKELRQLLEKTIASKLLSKLDVDGEEEVSCSTDSLPSDATPQALINLIMPDIFNILADNKGLKSSWHMIDPFAGDLRLLKALINHNRFFSEVSHSYVACEIDSRKMTKEVQTDIKDKVTFTSYSNAYSKSVGDAYDFVFSNVPFKGYVGHIERCLSLVAPGGYLGLFIDRTKVRGVMNPTQLFPTTPRLTEALEGYTLEYKKYFEETYPIKEGECKAPLMFVLLRNSE